LPYARSRHTRSPRAAARPAASRRVERELRDRQSNWLPSEPLLGLILLILGLAVAVLILTGTLKVGFSS
jgi:hypothetical protein